MDLQYCENRHIQLDALTLAEWNVLRAAVAAWPYYEDSTSPARFDSPGWGRSVGPEGELYPTVALAQMRAGRTFVFVDTQHRTQETNEADWYLIGRASQDVQRALGGHFMDMIFYRKQRPRLLAAIDECRQKLAAATEIAALASSLGVSL